MRNDKIYKRINDFILKQMEQGRLPWQQPWKNFEHKNFTSGHVYRGSNIWILSMMCNYKGFELPLWAGMKQINKAGGKVLKGEKGVPILRVFKKRYIVKGESDDDGNPLTKEYLNMSYVFVWNIGQTDLDPAKNKYVEEWEESDAEEIPEAESIVAGYQNPPKIKIGPKASYLTTTDTVTVPSIKAHNSEVEYYSTLYHELVHSTGHKSRLDRKLGGQHSKEVYSFEELIAELGACYLNNIVGIQTQKVQKNSAAYIQGWMKYLKTNPKAFIQAGSAAEKAVQHIIGKEE